MVTLTTPRAPESPTVPSAKGAGKEARLLVLVGVLAGLLASPASAVDLDWPLPISPRAITGTFMEPRSAHYHSGLDIKTEGRVGVPVLAPAAGSVRRLRVSPRGYGLAVYLELEDGRTLVFAHLDRFADRLRGPVVERQAETGRYRQDLYLDPGELRVARGELLAHSGATGTGAPHLHFEVRDAAERPRNPLLEGLSVPDHEPPTIRRFRVLPADATGRIEGRARPRIVSPGGSVSGSGALVVQVEVLDHTGVFRHRLMPLGVELRVDGEVVHRLEQETFAFSQGRQMRLEIVPDGREPTRRWLRLYRFGGNDLPARSGPGGIEVRGEHRVEVRAWDASGHETTAGFTVHPDSPKRTARATDWSLSESVLAVAGPPGGTRELRTPSGPRVLTLDAAGEAAVDLAELPSGPWSLDDQTRVVLRGGEGVERLELQPGVHVDDPTGQALFPGGGLWMTPEDSGPDLPPTLRAAGPVWRVEGESAAFRSDLRLELPVETTEPVVGLLRDARGRWSTLDTERIADGRVAVDLDGLGWVLPVRDTAAPVFSPFRARGRDLADGADLAPRRDRGSGGMTRARWPSVSVDVSDPGSGIPDPGPRCTVDGQPYPARWDPEEERVVFEWDVDPGPGEHVLQVEAIDATGRTAVQEIRLRLR